MKSILAILLCSYAKDIVVCIGLQENHQKCLYLSFYKMVSSPVRSSYGVSGEGLMTCFLKLYLIMAMEHLCVIYLLKPHAHTHTHTHTLINK